MQLANLFREHLLMARIWWYELALSEIEPWHRDVPEIVLTLRKLSDELDELKGKA